MHVMNTEIVNNVCMTNSLHNLELIKCYILLQSIYPTTAVDVLRLLHCIYCLIYTVTLCADFIQNLPRSIFSSSSFFAIFLILICSWRAFL
mmetsp:Transcript_28025/g.45122  ORF Transcript_28025/g.45122 Transcript_28025/m.45122 type:complete len:91 (-) Transcript_28025:1042-1314(-)